MPLVDSMGRPLNPSPTYVYHPSGTARIYWRGKFRNLPGQLESSESRAAFARLCEYVAIYGELPLHIEQMTMGAIGEKYLAWARHHYQGSNEARNVGYAVKACVALFADMPVESFGPAELKAMRSSIVRAGLCRDTANRRAKQVTAMIRWAVEEGHASESVWARLRAVRPIPPGREGAHDYEKIGPVSADHIVAVNKMVAARYRPALDVQRLTGMRSGELLSMRPQDVDMTGRHWYYTPVKHKTHRAIGVKIIGIPASAVETLTACMPKTWAERWFPWSVDTHRQAVKRACEAAQIPPWHPHQLRHNTATELEKRMGEAGKEAARLLLGHTNAKTTERYVAPSPESLASILDHLC